jgi:hypothetical protein
MSLPGEFSRKEPVMRQIIRVSVRILLAVSLVTMLPRTSEGQERQGFWIGGGGGYGSADVSCDECEDDRRESSGAAYLKAGWTLTPRLLVGGEFNIWRKEVKDLEPNVDATLNIYNASATVTLYPQASSGLFIKGGLGASFLDTEFALGRTSILADLGRGLGLIAGVGYDIPLGGRVSLTPALNFWFGQIGDLEVERETFVRDWKQNVIDITVGLTFH